MPATENLPPPTWAFKTRQAGPRVQVVRECSYGGPATPECDALDEEAASKALVECRTRFVAAGGVLTPEG